VAGTVVAVAVVLLGLAVVLAERGARNDLDRGERSVEVDDRSGSPVILDRARTVLVGDHLVSIDDEVIVRDVETLSVIAEIEAEGTRVTFGADPLILLASSTDGVVAHDADGTELWRRESAVPMAVGSDGAVSLASCEAARCTVTSVEPSGTVRWEVDLDGGRSPVSFAGGQLLTYPGDRAVAALPSLIVAVVAAGDGSDVVSVEPQTGEVRLIRSDVRPVDIAVSDDAIAVLSGSDSDSCVLSIHAPDGTQRAEHRSDCSDPSDGSDTAYLYAAPDGFVWVDATTIRNIDGPTGAEVSSVALGDPAGTPTRAGVLRAGGSGGDGWVLEKRDGTDVLAGGGWEWVHDVSADAVVLGREVQVGPPWRRSTVHEVAVIDVETGERCAWQRVPDDPFPAAVALAGCRAVVTSGSDGGSWLIGS